MTTPALPRSRLGYRLRRLCVTVNARACHRATPPPHTRVRVQRKGHDPAAVYYKKRRELSTLFMLKGFSLHRGRLCHPAAVLRSFTAHTQRGFHSPPACVRHICPARSVMSLTRQSRTAHTAPPARVLASYQLGVSSA